jgi:hypothetical protein
LMRLICGHLKSGRNPAEVNLVGGEGFASRKIQSGYVPFLL